jgi:hypothetical protein
MEIYPCKAHRTQVFTAPNQLTLDCLAYRVVNKGTSNAIVNEYPLAANESLDVSVNPPGRIRGQLRWQFDQPPNSGSNNLYILILE